MDSPWYVWVIYLGVVVFLCVVMLIGCASLIWKIM